MLRVYETGNFFSFLKRRGLKARSLGHLITKAFFSCSTWIIEDYLLKAKASLMFLLDSPSFVSWKNLPSLL